MKTTLILFLSCVTMLGTKYSVLGQLPGMNQGQGQNPSVIYPNPVIPLPKFQGFGSFQAGAGGAQPQFGMPQFNEEQKKCLTSFANKGMQSCLEDLGSSFATHKINVRPDCCTALGGLKDACKSVVHFQNPLFEALVKRHCASGGSAGGAMDAADAGAADAAGSGPGAEDAAGSGSDDAAGSGADDAGGSGPGAGAADAAGSTDATSLGSAGASSLGSAGGSGSADPNASGAGSADASSGSGGSGPTDPNASGAGSADASSSGSAAGSGPMDSNASGARSAIGSGPTDPNASGAGSAGAVASPNGDDD